MGNLLWMMMELLIYSGAAGMAARMTDDWQHLTGDTYCDEYSSSRVFGRAGYV